MKKIATSHLILVITVILALGVQLLLLAVGVTDNAIYLVAGQLGIMLPGIIYILAARLKFTEVIRFKRINIRTILLAVLVIIFSWPVVATLNMISMMFVDNALVSTVESLMDYGFWFSLVVMAVMPAFGEELVFRGLLYNTYSKQRPVFGMFFSAILFALMHMNFNQIPYALVLGIIMVLMIEASDSILTTMIMHFALNGSSVLLNFSTAGVLNAAASVNDIGVDITIEELMAMPEMTMIVAGMCIISLICLGIIAGLIGLTFKVNGRHLGDAFKRDKVPGSACYTNRKGQIKRNRMIDLWVILFVLYSFGSAVIAAVGWPF